MRGRRSRRLDGARIELGADLVHVLARPSHGVLELAHPLSHRAADLRQTLRAEQQERQQQKKNDLAGSDVSEHGAQHSGTRVRVPSGGEVVTTTIVGTSNSFYAGGDRRWLCSRSGTCTSRWTTG